MARDLDNLIPDILDRIDVGVLVLDRELRVRHWNRFMAAHTGRRADELLGREVFAAFPELPEAWLRRKCAMVFTLGQSAFSGWQQRPYLFPCKSRLPLTAGLKHMRQDCTFLPLKVGRGEVDHVCVVITDVTEVAVYQQQLKKALAEIEELSARDGLTGVFNRRRLDELLELEFSRHKRYSSCLALALLDIDHFKSLNDTHGHQFGDEVLRGLARSMEQTVRVTDSVGRYGGEEFLIIMPGIDGEQGVAAAERFRRLVEGLSFVHEGEEVRITVSIGVCEVRPRHAAAADAVGDADAALYDAKDRGRNLVVLVRDRGEEG